MPGRICARVSRCQVIVATWRARSGQIAPVGNRSFVLCGLLIGCATAGRDAREAPDANNHPTGDANNVGSTDGPSGCTVSTADLLSNGAFDMTPMGMGWASTPANPAYPVVTANGLTPQSAPNKAWMGSVVSASDDMHEDIAIPASTTALVLAGFYEVRTTETGTTANDTAKVELTDTSGTLLESALALDNTQAGTTWVPFSYTVTGNHAGQTVRVRFTTQNNSTKATSFYFDTISAQATYCH
jgi:hypothetical protein